MQNHVWTKVPRGDGQMTAKKLDVPFVFTESGTDTLATEHKLPSVTAQRHVEPRIPG